PAALTRSLSSAAARTAATTSLVLPGLTVRTGSAVSVPDQFRQREVAIGSPGRVRSAEYELELILSRRPCPRADEQWLIIFSDESRLWWGNEGRGEASVMPVPSPPRRGAIR